MEEASGRWNGEDRFIEQGEVLALMEPGTTLNTTQDVTKAVP